MDITSFEASVVNGSIRIPAGISVSENARVTVTVTPTATTCRITSPKLADPSQVSDFAMEAVESTDASL